MKKLTPTFILCAFALLLLFPESCATKSVKPEERLFKAKCSGCHLPPRQMGISKEEWKKIAEKHRNRVPLSVEEEEAIFNILAAVKSP
ncbi:MAG: hypothetical protein Kow0090_00810 [Myxococcota bacterium]